MYDGGRVPGMGYGAIGSAYDYNSHGYDGPGALHQQRVMEKSMPHVGRRQKLNVVAICLNVFVPWLVFCVVTALLSFVTHFVKPYLCHVLIAVTLAVLVASVLLNLLYIFWKRQHGTTGLSTASWLVFMCSTSIVAVLLAVAVGNLNFWTNMQVYYDVTSLNSYNDIDVAKTQGQEIMDAGRVAFASGTHIDLSKAMGFRNQATFCVAPITSSSIGDASLPSYDFWAVGKDCCSGGMADFHCGAYNLPNARGGVRLMRDEDRDYYRLAVQQAQSAYQIKVTHPLFFHWVADPMAATTDYKMNAYRIFMAVMFGHLLFQLMMVFIAANIFAKFQG